jgi:hypothetical protein
MSDKPVKKVKSNLNSIQIPSRRLGGKKKPDLFAKFREEHPLEDLFPSIKSDTVLDSQTTKSNIALDSQENIKASLDSQKTNSRLSDTFDFGYPNDKNLAINLSKEDVWIAKKDTSLAIKLSKEENLDSQTLKQKGKWTKYDKNRNRKGIFLRTNDGLTKNFKKFCIDNNLEFSQATELAWMQFMESLDSQSNVNLAIKIAHDDRRLMINWKSRVFIINLYLRYNEIFNKKTRWTINDDEKALRFNEVNPKVIELGIIQTQFQKGFKGKINSFSYYINEIENFMELGMDGEVLETMLKINRQRWQKATGKEINYNEFDK